MTIWRTFWTSTKALLADLTRVAGLWTQAHRKGIKALLLVSVVAFFILLVGLLQFSETSTFCGLCHQMDAYIDSWQASSHRDVSCTKCHYEPGFFSHLKGKWVDGQVSLAFFLSGKTPTKPHAEISDASCLQCHKLENLQGNMIYKNVAFPHGAHLGELRRGMKLRCTSCHAQIVQGAHLTVHETNCFICHYYKAGTQGEEECLSCSIGGCTACHFEPKGDIKVNGWNFNHKKYIARGVSCEKCHVNVVQGDGHIPEGKCVECHNEPEILTAKYTSQALHKNHVTDHKIECSGCHSPLRHRIGGVTNMAHSATVCDRCHAREMHGSPRDLYAGTGGIGVPDSPSLMFSTKLDCVTCHRKSAESHAALHTSKYTEKALGEACVDCHGAGFDETLRQWKRLLARGENETNERIFQVQRVLYELEKTGRGNGSLKKAKQLLSEARHNYNVVVMGKGAHNIEYAIKLLNVANSKAEQALATVDPNHKPREAATRMTCTTLCHIDLEKRKVPFGDIQFSHETHVLRQGMKCSDCHSPREKHGKTFFKNCSSCHHGKGTKNVSCEDCHLAVKRVVQGKGGLGVKDKPSMKLDKVDCVDCHQGVAARKKDSFEAIQKRCVECHDQSYGEMATKWKKNSEELLKKVSQKMDQVKAEIDRIERLGGRTFVYRKLLGDAEFNYNLAKQGNGIHNVAYVEALLEAASQRVDQAIQQLAKRKKEVAQAKAAEKKPAK